MLKKGLKVAAFILSAITICMFGMQKNTYANEVEGAEILLTFGGDVTFGYKNDEEHEDSQPYFLKENGMDYSIIFKNVYDIFSNDDLTMVNLETTITDATRHMDKTYYFRAPYDYVNILTEGSVEAVSIANNHAKDYLDQGRRDTVRTLYENDILVAGENYAASVEIKGIKVGILAYVTFQTGFNYKSAIERDVSYMDRTHDVVIVSMHWGQELHYDANGGDIELAHDLIDYGADLVVGHHPHVIQGIENYNGKYIVYSLGNCSFAGSSNPTNDDILLFQQKFKMTENGVVPSDARVIPCRVSSQEHKNDFMPTPFEGDEAVRVINRVLDFSSNMEYGLVELSTDWIKDPYTRKEYRLDKQNEDDNG